MESLHTQDPFCFEKRTTGNKYTPLTNKHTQQKEQLIELIESLVYIWCFTIGMLGYLFPFVCLATSEKARRTRLAEVS